MDNKQQSYIKQLYSQIRKLKKSAKKASKGKLDSINRELLDKENHLSRIIRSLSQDDSNILACLLQEKRTGKDNKHIQNVKTTLESKQSFTHESSLSQLEASSKLESIRELQEYFIHKGLIKGFKKFKNSNLDYSVIKTFLSNQVKEAVNQGRIPEVLSLINESGRNFDQDIAALLKIMYQKRDFASFLKQSYRLNYYLEIKEEIDAAIQWYIDNKKPDAHSWRVKFDKLAHSEKCLANNEEFEDTKIRERENTKSNRPIQLQLVPIYRKGNSVGNKTTEDNEEYVNVQYEKWKLDQANLSHHDTQVVLEDFLDIFSVPHEETQLIDVYANINEVHFIFEIKSITLRNERPQNRNAVAQLLEYAYRYDIHEPQLYLVYSSKPHTEWLLDFLHEQHINVIWVDDSKNNHLDGPGLKSLEHECLRYYRNKVQSASNK